MVFAQALAAFAQDDNPEVGLLNCSGDEVDTDASSDDEQRPYGVSQPRRRWRAALILSATMVVLGILCVGVVGRSASTTAAAGKGATSVQVVNAAIKAQTVSDLVCTSNSTEGTCKLLANFARSWHTANAEKCQEAMDMYTTRDIGVELALSKTQYVLIYHGNVGHRFGEYLSSGEFNFKTDAATHWTVRQQGVDEVTAFRPMTMFMNVGWFKMHAMFLVLRARPEGFPDSTAQTVENCPDGCRANVWLRLRKTNGVWVIREVAIIKLE
jgi:Flp pilus assembly protein TadG